MEVGLEKGGPVLGVLARCVFEEGEVTVQDRDVLILYSDGLAEAADRSDVQFGDDRLLATVRANWDRPVDQIQHEILDAVHRFIAPCELQDDLTLVVVRVGARPARDAESAVLV